jgi:hypothetical protein
MNLKQEIFHTKNLRFQHKKERFILDKLKSVHYILTIINNLKK